MKINIAIDGYSSCGKSSTSKKLAKKLHYKYIDTGAMYRAVTYYFLQHKIDWKNENQLTDALNHIHINFQLNEWKENRTVLNGEDVEEAIRTMEVSKKVSEVSTVSAVRKMLVEQQQKIAIDKGVVMDGRDIGTVVLPNAELKIFMTAGIEVRTKRRWLELQANGIDLTYEEVKNNLEHRDLIDSTRLDSPLKQASDALLLDTSEMRLEEQIEWIYSKALSKIN
ncbi:MAG: (d)CMP kinase [Bacteroidetes bacterium]|nr:(d)CMP kinase [Bacteroidota bacterium]